MTKDRIRVASLQYFIRPVHTFDQFRDQVEALVETAEDYKCQLLVFPEYFTVQLLTLGDTKRPMPEQIRDLARQTPRFMEMMLVGELNMSTILDTRTMGTVLPLLDSRRSREIASHIETVAL